ncbi:hypothetical protein Dsin_002637 [Dipteronia sinensis]|uniref:Histone acetyltransferase n=1 Tax=Dipteronia sinensis TaxID=43782 RepID=A0AAE0B649_9ROSI|nr:hypothetical protein Dsin_002637 [Dipteronia sinensis]
MTRHQKQKIDETHVEGHEELDAASLREHEEFTKVKNIATIELGRYEIETWYFSPFLPEYSDCLKMYFCEFCLNFMKRKEQLQRHMVRCSSNFSILWCFMHPPGDEIYRSGILSMFEVDGKKNKVYGQNLSFITMMLICFCSMFCVNVMIEDATRLAIFPRIFSEGLNASALNVSCDMMQEKHSEESYNLACILTLPPYQRKGYGNFLIAFFKRLARVLHKVGFVSLVVRLLFTYSISV